MWQQNPFPVDNNRFLRDYCGEAPLERLIRVESAAAAAAAATSKLFSFAPSSCLPDSDWQRAAGLVQSPASVNSEGSSTSTPDQCPASPAPTFCEMPSSRNGSCNNPMIQKEMHQQIVWKSPPIPSQSSSRHSLMDMESGTWSLPQSLTEANNLFGDQAQAASGWSPISNQSEMPSESYMLSEGLLVSGAELSGVELMSRTQAQDTASLQVPMPVEIPKPLQGRPSAPVQISNDLQRSISPGSQTFNSLHQVEMQVPPRIKQEEECFLGGRNGLVIDDKILSLQRPSLSSSKIGNFMDLLRQSDRPISDATAAASCNHLSQLLSSQDAPEMWIAHSSRLPAMLSEVLPSASSGGKLNESSEQRSKRKVLTCSTPDIESRERIAQHDQVAALLNPKHQDEDEPSNDRVPSLGTNDSEPFSKRSKLENSNSFPFKMQVRKEKLGERISALQQLVSPFGKTDTASVLLEAIGYIKFLHEQVQVLSSPYMKHTGTSTIRHNEHGKFCEETKQDLRSRGLCLVPISCTLQVANDNGADYWTPTLHGGLK